MDWGPYLEAGEVVLWQGQPDGRLVLFLTGSDLFLVPFCSLFWLASPLIVLGAIVSPDQDGLPPAIMILFPMIYLAYLFPGRAILDRRTRRALRFAITARRVLRLDTKAKSLTQRAITPDLHIGLKGRRLITIELDRYKPDAKVPVPSHLSKLLGYRWDGSATGASFDPRVSMLFVYIEYGLELRRLQDGKDVVRLLKDLRANAQGDAT